jgi:histidine triad (HIT) family protein
MSAVESPSDGGAAAPGCPFCGIVARRVAAHVIFRDELTVAFLDSAPAAEGHTLVAPKLHARDLFDASAETVAAVMRTAQIIATGIIDNLGAHGVTLFQANRSAGWQDVFHLHMHVVPRWPGDALVRPWRSAVADSGTLAQTAHRLRASL